jgi:hypothetical protein
VQAADLGDEATLIIDGHAPVCAIGIPPEAKTFGDLADTFVTSMLQSGAAFRRIDVVFDIYYDRSIKSGTRKKRTKQAAPVRREIKNRDVPLPPKWENFSALDQNKTDLARFLAHELLLQAPHNKIIVISGGFLKKSRLRQVHQM